MFGVFGQGQRIKENQGSSVRKQHLNLVAALVFHGARACNIHVTGPTQSHAGLAASQVINHGAGKKTDMRPHLGQHVASGPVVGGFVGIRVFAQEMQGWWKHFGRRIQKSDAARLEFGGVSRIENQFPGIFGQGQGVRRGAQGLGHLGFVDADRGKAPGPGNEVSVAGVNTAEFAHDGWIKIAVIGDLAFVELLQKPAVNLRLGKHRTGHHQVVASVARHQLGMQGFVVLKGLVVDLDAGFLLEVRYQVLGDVVWPVINIQHLLFNHGDGCRRAGSRRWNNQCNRGFRLLAACSQSDG